MDASPYPHPRLRRMRRALLVVVVVLGALLLWTAGALLSVRGALHRAQDELARATETGSLVETRNHLREAGTELREVHGRLAAPGPLLVAQLPLLGRTPRAVLAATEAAQSAAAAGVAVLDATSVGPPILRDGGLNPASLARVSAALRRSARDTASPVRRLAAVETSLTPGQVGRAVLEARGRLDDLPSRLDSAADAIDALAGLTGAHRQRRLLIVLENNAELRGSGGIVTVFAEATARSGNVQLQAFRDVDEVADVASAVKRVPSPPDYHRLWGRYLADSTLWKNTNMSPDIATSSAVLARVAGTSLGRTPDAVLWLDARTLADIVGATSPARLPDGTVLTKDSTVPALLSGAYRSSVDTTAGQAARRARLRAAADAVAARLFHDIPDATRLGLALAGAARGRHLAVWSANPSEQAALARASLAGQVRADDHSGRGDIASAVVQNFGGGDRDGNKLDFFARRLLKIRVQVSGRTAEVEQEFSLRNTAPLSGLPVYVAGGATPGTSNNFLTLAVPATATLLSFTRGGQPVHTDVLAEEDHRVVADALSLPPGTTATWRLRYRLALPADGRYTLHAYPQPLAVDGGLSVDITSAPGRLRSSTGRVGDVHLSGAFADQLTLSVMRTQESVLSRSIAAVRRFWTHPVSLPF